MQDMVVELEEWYQMLPLFLLLSFSGNSILPVIFVCMVGGCFLWDHEMDRKKNAFMVLRSRHH